MTKGPCPKPSSTAFSTSPGPRHPSERRPQIPPSTVTRASNCLPNLKELKEGLGLQWEPRRQRPGIGHPTRIGRLGDTALPQGHPAHPERIGVRIRYQGRDAHHPHTPVKSSTSLGPGHCHCCGHLAAAGVPAPDLAAVSNLREAGVRNAGCGSHHPEARAAKSRSSPRPNTLKELRTRHVNSPLPGTVLSAQGVMSCHLTAFAYPLLTTAIR